MEQKSAHVYDSDHTVSKCALLLTGGRSSRMGHDKSEIPVFGEKLGARIARLLHESGWALTVLGRKPISGFDFIADAEEFQGPLSALKKFRPVSEFVFVISCDIPLFDPRSPDRFASQISDYDAVIPVVEGRAQPLCALYRQTAWDKLQTVQSQRVFDWIDQLEVKFLDERELEQIGVAPHSVSGVNTADALERLLNDHLATE